MGNGLSLCRFQLHEGRLPIYMTYSQQADCYGEIGRWVSRVIASEAKQSMTVFEIVLEIGSFRGNFEYSHGLLRSARNDRGAERHDSPIFSTEQEVSLFAYGDTSRFPCKILF